MTKRLTGSLARSARHHDVVRSAQASGFKAGAWSRWALAAVLAAALVRPAAVWAKTEEPELIAPITPWHVDWAKSSCGLRRVFGKPDSPILLQFEQFEPGSTFQLTLTGKRIRQWAWEAGFSIRYGDAGSHDLAHAGYGVANDRGTPMILIAASRLTGIPAANQPPRPTTPEIEAAISRITIRQGARQFALATGSLGRPFAELHRCTEQLVASWGLDPAAQMRRSRAPVPIDPDTWLKGANYPRQAITTGIQSLINFRLTVDEHGVPTACEVQSSYSGEYFEKRTCEALMRQARFEPALDAVGKPMTSYYASRAGWFFGRP